jgi:predicted oxidoreductase
MFDNQLGWLGKPLPFFFANDDGAGAGGGAARGSDALPGALLERLEQCEPLKALARSLAEAASNRPTDGCT